jgi:hypothetical protein
MTAIFTRLRQRLFPTRSGLELAQPTAPRLKACTPGITSVQLRLTADGSGGIPATHLVLVGRRDGYEQILALVATDSAWTVEVDDDLLERFGTDTINVFVAGTGQARRRLAAVGTHLASRPSARWQWYTTSEGNVSIRRSSPVEVIRHAGVFDADHYRAQLPDLPADVDPIEHYVTTGAADGLNPSTMFDTAYYRRMNPAIHRRNPLAHYCEHGWKELFDPSPEFSTWWYWFTNMDPAEQQSNPLAHFEASGKQRGLPTRPNRWPSRSLGTGHRLDGTRPIRRICLFAGWDPDGIIDEYVIAYVRELARFADVYYLADCELSDAELDKLSEITRGAWGLRHGAYDFGSYARLTDLIGWEVIEQYDELLLVNDSSYLLRSLDMVFSTMAASACDWWGLQATKGIRETRGATVNQFRDPIPMERVRSTLVDAFERDYTYDFLIGSYFLAFRQPVIRDPAFRRYLGSVATLDKKRHIVKTYEVGLTRWLIQHGHPFETYIPRLYPFHPIFTRWYFRLLDDGFPLLKRYFLAENHYGVPRLAEWPELIRQRVPDADVAMFERNLRRVSDPEKLRRSLHVGDPAPTLDGDIPSSLLSPSEFIEADLLSPKHADWWAFPVSAIASGFSGNVRAVFEEVKDDRAIHKVVLSRGSLPDLEGTNVEVVPLDSPLGQHRLMRAATILLDHDSDAAQVPPVSADLHNLILMPHDAPLLRRGHAAEQTPIALAGSAAENARYRAVIAPTGVAALATAANSYPLTIHQVWTTGLPRHDFITRPEEQLPEDLRAELAAVRDLVGDRRLVLLFPAEGGLGYQFTRDEVAWLRTWVAHTDSVLGALRPDLVEQLSVLDLSALRLVHLEMLHRASTALITDDAGAFVDHVLTGEPMVSFVPEQAARRFTRPLFCDLDVVFPGPVCRTFAEFQAALGRVFTEPLDPAHEARRRLFFDRADDQNSARVAARIRDLVSVHGIGTWPGERSL